MRLVVLLFLVDGVVIKAHGSSSAYAFKNAIRQARLAVLMLSIR